MRVEIVHHDDDYFYFTVMYSGKLYHRATRSFFSAVYYHFGSTFARITNIDYCLVFQTLITASPTNRLTKLHITGIKYYHSSLEDHFERQDADWMPTTCAKEQIRNHVRKEPRIVVFNSAGVGVSSVGAPILNTCLIRFPNYKISFRKSLADVHFFDTQTF